jgi:hypothetical protein
MTMSFNCSGSWIPDLVVQCDPPTYDKYPPEKTTYNNATLRAFNMLVETSHQKIPNTQMLGNNRDVMSKDTSGNGHISRNIRLSLLSAELVEPYVSVVAVNDLALSDDIVPLVERNCATATKRVMIPRNVQQVTVEWTVGGSLAIDETQIWVTPAVPDGTLDCVTQPLKEVIEASFKPVTPNGDSSGLGYFAMHGPYPHPSVSNSDVEPSLGPLFSATIDVAALKTGEKVTVIASAKVDSEWAKKPAANVGPDVPPQAHVVNARTNPDWYFESAGKIIQGHLDWFSVPVDIVVGDYDSSVGQNQAGREISTIEVSNRFGETTGLSKGGVSPRISHGQGFLKHATLFYTGLAVCSVALIFFVLSRRRNLSYDFRLDTYDDDEDEEEDDFAGTKPYADDTGDVEMSSYHDDPVTISENPHVQNYTID